MGITRCVAAAGTAAAILAALLAWAPAASAASATGIRSSMAVCPHPSGRPTMPGMPGMHACGPHHLNGPAMETTFMAGMIRHHAAAVAMARLELARGTHAQLKAVAQQIIASQNTQIGQMTRWLHAWYGLTPAQARTRTPADLRSMLGSMDAGMRQMMARLAAVPAGPAFDRAFMEAMIPHHQMAIMESRTVSERADHPQLRTLASQIITSQSTEIRQMRAWLHAWYGVNAAP